MPRECVLFQTREDFSVAWGVGSSTQDKHPGWQTEYVQVAGAKLYLYNMPAPPTVHQDHVAAEHVVEHDAIVSHASDVHVSPDEVADDSV